MRQSAEYSELFDALRELRAKSSKHLIIIAVGSEDCIETLDSASEKLLKESWRRKLRPWKGPSSASVYLCTPEDLQDTLSDAEELCEGRDHRKDRSVAIVASRAISELDVNVSGSVRSLAILGPRAISSSSGGLKLLESSSFCDVPIAEWQNNQPRGYDLLTGEGVMVQVNRSSPSLIQQRQLENEDLTEIRRHLENMEAQAQRGQGSWKRWRGPAAAIIGVLTGAGVVVAKTCATATGFSFTLGALKLSSWGVSMKMTLVAAGWGFAAGAAAALIVYAIPWDILFNWLGRILGTIWSWLCDLFCLLQDAVRSFQARAEAERRGRRRSRTRSRRPHHASSRSTWA